MRKWIYRLLADGEFFKNWNIVYADTIEEAIERTEREWKDTPFTPMKNSFKMVIQMENGIPVGEVIY